MGAQKDCSDRKTNIVRKWDGGSGWDVLRKRWKLKHFIETESRRKIQRNTVKKMLHRSVEDLGNILFEVEICKG